MSSSNVLLPPGPSSGSTDGPVPTAAPESLSQTSISPRNPGTIEELHRASQMLLPVPFEGAKIMVNKGLSSHFEISHSLTMSQMSPSGYRFGATFAGTKRPSVTEAFPILMGDIDAGGNMNANVIHALTDKIRTKCIVQIEKQKFQSLQMTSDYRAENYTASLTIANPDVKNKSGIAVLHYLRAITDRFCLGSEITYQAAPQIPGGHVAVVAMAGRYQTESTSVAATLGAMGSIHATAKHKLDDSPTTLVAEVEANLPMKDVTATMGYEHVIGKGDFTMRAAVDSNLMVRSVVETKLLPLPFTLALSSMLNHKKNQYSFGIGLIVS